MYATGRGVPMDYAEGYAWLTFASEQGDERGTRERELLREKMTSYHMDYSLKRIKELRGEIKK